jgi:hypothetical protein
MEETSHLSPAVAIANYQSLTPGRCTFDLAPHAQTKSEIRHPKFEIEASLQAF